MAKLRQLFLIIALLPVCVMAQEEEPEPFTSDLFGGPTSTDALPKGRLQWETYAFYERNALFGYETKSWCFNSSMLRYGVINGLELCMKAAWLHTRVEGEDGEEGENLHGIGDLAVGAKACLFKGWKAIPSIALRGYLYFPGGKNSDFLPQKFNYELDLIFNNQINSWFDVAYMGGVYWDDTPRPTILWDICLNFTLSDKFTLSLEQDNDYVGSAEEEKVQSWAEIGFFYQVHPRVELGIVSDVNLRHFKDYFNVMLGMSWQLTKK